MLKRITTFIEEQGSVPGVQLAHAGRKASHRSPWKGANLQKPEEGGWLRVAPSAIPFQEGEDAPQELTAEGIAKVIADFRAATERSLRAGFKVIEIHAAHGYLLHEFLSPLSNQRKDKYGGTFENRIRLLLEVIANVQQVWPADLPLFVRISATDWTEGGWTGDDSVKLAAALKDKGIDLIDCSTGGNVPRADIPVGPCYQVPFAERIKKETGMATGAVGMITTAQESEDIISSGKADMVMLARELLRDPYFPIHAALELGYDYNWPDQYERAKPRRRV